MIKKILLASILAIFLFSGTSQAQANDLPQPGMLPDSPFYFMKSFFEGIGTFFAFNDLAKAERFLNLAETRLAEAKALAEKGKSQLAERSVERYQEQINRALSRAEQARTKGLDIDEVMAKVSEATLRHQAVLADVYQKVPEQAQPAIQRAMEASMRGYEEALRAVSKEKQEEVIQQMEQKREEVEKRVWEAREKGVPVPILPTPEEIKERIMEGPAGTFRTPGVR